MKETFRGQIVDGERAVLAKVEGVCVKVEPIAEELIFGPNEPLGGRFVPGRLGEWYGEADVLRPRELWLDRSLLRLLDEELRLLFGDGREAHILITDVACDKSSPPRIKFLLRAAE